MKRREKHNRSVLLSSERLFSKCVCLLLGSRGRHVDINFAAAATAPKDTPAKQKERDQNDDYKNYQYCDHTRAAAAIIITHLNYSSFQNCPN
jgi:hypothetical protein